MTIQIWFIFALINQIVALSYNQPRFCPNATWNLTGITFAESGIVRQYPRGIFINSNNSIYVPNRENGRIHIWENDSVNPTKNISGSVSSAFSIFVTNNGHIYVDNGNNRRVDKWRAETNTWITVMLVNSTCHGLFVDIYLNLYCSMGDHDLVVRESLNDTTNMTGIVAGIGVRGNTSNMLSFPYGIFVDINLDLYVADSGNNRIQLFRSGQLTGTTVAGRASSPPTIDLTGPSGIILDADQHLFIVDRDNHRIIGSDGNGFRCIIACSGEGSSSDKLSFPISMSFDRYGNIYVTDTDNHRIQKFVKNSFCGQSTVVSTTSHISTEELPSTIMTTSLILTTEMAKTITTTTKIISTQKETTMTVSSMITTQTEMTTTLKVFISTQETVLTTFPITTTRMEMVTTKTSSSFVSEKSCLSPQITLIPHTNSPQTPLQYRRSQDFYILSTIQLQCDQSLSTIKKWTIRNYTTNSYSKIPLKTKLTMTNSELYVPSNTLPYGVYQFEFQVSMSEYPSLANSSSIYVEISPSGITANLVPLGTSVITSGHQQNLTLNPGNYSTDPDGYAFDASDWFYIYFCRIYEPNRSFSPIDSCLTNQSKIYQYDGVLLSPNSSLTIFADVLQLNKTYQFLVQMSNRRNASLHATGYAIVEIKDSNRPMIGIGCVIGSLCAPNLEFQKVNPTTQVALYSLCDNQCPNPDNITWNIYHGQIDSTHNYTQWILFSQMDAYENRWFYGRNTTKFTATKDLFLRHSNETHWKFEVVYSFGSIISTSALNFEINPPPSNGTCQINPTKGTTNTLFNITCADWFNKDNIKEYSLFTIDRSQLQIITFSPIPTFEVRLPVGENLNLVIHIRDTLDCIAEYNLSSVNITFDSFLSQQNDSLTQLLSSGNQRTVGQIITLVTDEIDQMNNQTIDKAISNGIPLTTISISSLGSQRSTQGNRETINQSARFEFLQENNNQANLRECLIRFTDDFTITSANSFKLQSLSLVQLTSVTHQLTRTSSLFAFNKCFQLTEQLPSWSNKLPFEDIQIITTQLLQCASNILTAVNGPLQKRMEVLDKDFTSATEVPKDYDTDLELEWANPNLFADGDDFSWNTLQQGKIFYFQKKLADEVNGKIDQMISRLTAALNSHINIGQHYTIDTPEVFMSLETISVKSLENKTIKQMGDAQIIIPKNLPSNFNPNQTISLRSMIKPMSVYGQSRLKTINTNLSRSVSLSILDQNGTEIPFETNHLTPIAFLIPHDPNIEIPPMISTNQSFHYVNLTSDLPISVHFEINADFSYLFIYKFDQLPIYNSSMQNIDGSILVNQTNFTHMINNQHTIGHRFLIFALVEHNSTESNYEYRVYTSGCFYLDKDNQWKSDGLTVGTLTSLHQTHCYSTHLTTFSGSIQILPPKLDLHLAFSNADFHRNRTIYSTVIVLIVIYILLMIYSRRKDRQDSDKLGLTPLADNHRDDHYSYEIIVFTGQRKDSGTDSKVHFILNGEQDHTFVRTFSNSSRKIFQRGQTDSFLMSVRQSLGPLNYLHLWHDNSGQGFTASWFLKCVIVRDLQTMETCYFIAQKWFAVEKDDGKVERAFPVASEDEKEQFSYLLSKKTYSKFSDEHLWFSIFLRSPLNSFTRLQRCTCCFVLFFLSMFFNILYYDLNQQNQSNNQLTFGPFAIPLQQIISGIIIEFFSLLISLLLVQFFRRIRTRQNRISPLNETLTKKVKFTFPWWCIFIAYAISILLILTSIFFILIRGIEFGNDKSQQWLISILIGFFSSIFLSQPLKIFLFSLIFVLFCRKQHREDEEYFQSKSNEHHLHSSTQKSSPSIHQIRLFEDRCTKEYLQATRLERMRDVHMYSFLQQSITYLLFFILLCLIIYPSQNQMHFYQVKHLKTYFGFDQHLCRVSTIDQYYSWLNDHFINNLRAQIWYNQKDPPKNLTGFINDKTNRLIGWATMRQLRVKTDLCFDRRVMTDCHFDSSVSNEEKRSFYPNWTTEKKEEEEDDYSSTILKAFQCHTGGYVYEFRGSLSDLRNNLTRLRQFNWIDEKTRAISIQLTLYNPNLQLFTSLAFLTEFFSTGHIQSEIQIQPMNFLSFTSLSQFICLILYLIIIVYFMWIQLRSLFDLKWKYFSQFWSYVQLGIIICSWTAVAVYIWRYKESQRIGQLFKQTHGYFYIDLQFAAYVNDLLTFLFGFCCFFGTIQFYHLCRFNQRLTLFDRTLKRSANDLGHFMLMFFFVFLAFVCLFYFLFSSQLRSYATFTRSAQMLFEMSLSKFDTKELLNADSFLGPLCFSLFMILIVFICMGMFISIINDSFQSVRKKKDNQPEVYSYIFNKFLRWARLKKPTSDEIHEETDKVMRSQYVPTIDHLMNKAQELSDIVDRMTSN